MTGALRRGLSIGSLGVIIVIGPSCRAGRDGPEPDCVADGDTREVLDIEQRSIRIPAHIDRIATQGTSLTSLLLTLGAGSKMAVVTPEIRSNPWAIKVAPHLAHLPVFFAGEDASSIESILSSRPDLVIAWSRAIPANILLETTHVPVAVVHFGSTHEILEAVSTLGRLLGPGPAEAARRYVERFRSVLERLAERTRDLPPSARPGVYYAAGDPLTTEGSASFVTSWIEAAGGENVAALAGIRASRATISLETLLAWDPDVIIVRDAATGRAIQADSRWAGARAVAAQRVLTNPRGVTSWCTRGGESLLQLLWAARTLHADWFTPDDFDLGVETRRFYEDFFGYRLNDTEIAEIFAPP